MSRSVPPGPSPPSQSPAEPRCNDRAASALSDPLPPRRRLMDAPRARSLRPSRFAAGSCQKNLTKIRIQPRFPAGRGERGCCRAPGQAGDAYRCILIVRAGAANHGPTATEAPGVRPCPSRGAAGAHAEVVRARSHGAAPPAALPKQTGAESGREVPARRPRAAPTAGTGSRAARRCRPSSTAVPVRTGLLRLAGSILGAVPVASQVTNTRGGWQTARRGPSAVRSSPGAGSGHGNRVPAARAARPRPHPGCPQSRFPHPSRASPVLCGAQVGLAGAGAPSPAPYRAPFPVSRRQSSSQLVPALDAPGAGGSRRRCSGRKASAQIPPPRWAPANLNNSEQRREHVQSAALPPAPEILMPRDEPSWESRAGCGTRSLLRPGQRRGAGLSPECPHTRDGRHRKRSRHPRTPVTPKGTRRAGSVCPGGSARDDPRREMGLEILGMAGERRERPRAHPDTNASLTPPPHRSRRCTGAAMSPGTESASRPVCPGDSPLPPRRHPGSSTRSGTGSARAAEARVPQDTGALR